MSENSQDAMPERISEKHILDEIASLKDMLAELLSQNATPEWVSISKAIQILGISRQDLYDRIQEHKIPFRKKGTYYSVNIRLARAYLCKEDIQNMYAVQRAIELQPFSRRKVTGDIGSRKKEPKVRRQY